MNLVKPFLKKLAVAALFASCTAQALPIIQADAFTTGDNKGARETSTGLVWMDFGVNNGKSYNQVVSELSSTYKGWRVATGDEVNRLFAELFNDMPFSLVDFDDAYWDGSEDIVNAVDAVFGVNSSSLSSNGVFETASAGWYLNENGGLSHGLISTYHSDTDTNGYAALCCAWLDFKDYGDDDESNNQNSTFLVRNSARLPEPSSIFMLGLGLFGLSITRKRTKK